MRSVLDRSDREDVRLHQPRCVKHFRYRSTRVRGQHSPLLLLYITMILRVRRNFFEITTFPNNKELIYLLQKSISYRSKVLRACS